ncbi:MAG: hypothetical protein ACK5RJ_16140 [Burkholderiales bacterium]|nr:hypothetical protein [Rhodocyclaceae bacterium]
MTITRLLVQRLPARFDEGQLNNMQYRLSVSVSVCNTFHKRAAMELKSALDKSAPYRLLMLLPGALALASMPLVNASRPSCGHLI